MATQYSWRISKGKSLLFISRCLRFPRCVGSINALDSLAQKYHRHGFVILGVNLDAKHSWVKDAKTAQPTARQFEGRDGVTWISPLRGSDRQSSDNITRAYGVDQIPANFLICSVTAIIVAVEQSGDAL